MAFVKKGCNLHIFLSDNGNNSRLFFNPKNRDDVINLLEDAPITDKIAFSKILQDTNILCRIANSTQKFDLEKVEKFCSKAYLHRVKSFPWAILSTSTHRGFGHIVKLMRKNGGRGLGNLSESPLESAHKILRTVFAKTSL